MVYISDLLCIEKGIKTVAVKWIYFKVHALCWTPNQIDLLQEDTKDEQLRHVSVRFVHKHINMSTSVQS